MKKRILFLISLLLFTGCNVNYNVVINEDLSVNDNLYIEGSKYLYSLYEKTSRLNVMKMLVKDNTDITLMTDSGYNYVFDESVPALHFNKKFDSIDDFVDNNIVYKNLFDELLIEKNGDIITIKGNGYKGNNIFRMDTYYLNNCDISVKTIYKVVDSSAYKFNENTNEFYFNMNDKSDDFDFYLSIDTSKKIIPYFKVYLVAVLVSISLIVIITLIIIDRNKNKNRI